MISIFLISPISYFPLKAWILLDYLRIFPFKIFQKRRRRKNDVKKSTYMLIFNKGLKTRNFLNSRFFLKVFHSLVIRLFKREQI
jgi:hypothetical protein